MSADLSSDPNILKTYNELRSLDSPVDWMYLGYAPEGPKDRLLLVGRGEGSLHAFVASLSASGRSAIYFGILREEGRFLLITILPEDAGGVKRARALVHSRAVGQKLSHQASVTVARPEDLSAELVRSKLKLDTGSASSSLPPSPNPQGQFPGGTPSPLRPQFSPSTQHTGTFSPTINGGNALPPHLPEKDPSQLAKMRSNASVRSNVSPRLSPNPQQYYVRAGSPSGQYTTSQLSPTYTSGASATGLGLGLPSLANGHTPSIDYRAASSPVSGSPRTASSTILASDQASSNPQIMSHQRSPRLASQPLRSSSPAPSHASQTSTHSHSQSQATYAPVGGPSEPASAGSLEPSTLASMLRFSDPDASEESIDVPSALPQTAQSPATAPTGVQSRRVSTEADRQRVAEAIARGVEERWHAHKRSMSQSSQAAPSPIGTTAPVLQPSGHTRNASQTSQRSLLREQLRLEQERLQNINAEQEQLQTVKQEANERNSLRAEQEEQASVPDEGAGIQPATEREKLLEVQRLEEERLAALKAEEEQLQLVRQQAEEDARRAEEQRREEERQRAASEQREREEEERLIQEAREREERERQEAERQAERERREAEEQAERERVEAAERAVREEREAAERGEREKREAAERAIREKEEARSAAKTGLQSRIRDSGNGDQAVLTGFVSAQGGASILWKRRYFEMTSSALKLYKNDKDTSAPIETVSLPNHVKNIEMQAEELMAIPHSFKVVFQNYDEEPMLFYCDEEDDRELLVTGLRCATRLP